MKIFSTFLLLFSAHLVGAIQTSNGTAAHPSLNVTAAIPYLSELDHWVRQKSEGKAKCNKLRTRVEWRNLTPTQRQSWIDAHWCLTTRPSVLAGAETNLDGFKTSLYDDFSLVHIKINNKMHFTAAFLPWHRMFILAHEKAMRECGYHGPIPYWHESIDADEGNVFQSPIFSNDRGVGGNGTGDNGTVTSGPFAYFPLSYFNKPGDNWTVVSYEPHYLTRAFGSNILPNVTKGYEDAYNTTSIRRVLEDGGDDFIKFHQLLEGILGRRDLVGIGPHDTVHRVIGGDMITPTSSYEPLFFPHHANVDRIWWNWQNGATSDIGPPPRTINQSDLNSRFWAYSGNTVLYSEDPTGGPSASLFDVQTVLGLLVPNMKTYELMDIERPPLCYTYD
ncbi:hypothetical protein OC846_005796 [Tilletia horrida]|uniref:Tyrosinase copper-binding domain-containing protein n=1 Tax=Tilletia horrida TaxID=155126 RepID=A0AAN6JP66_9BASI|nr:hypothetical protein OC846_005796 [Tilletia horrida]KAK0553263.1 hypothetical protein OC845_001263 [Tilletia horrida]KAK0570262.1 hypothetical protein OC861_000005 [Tilletia horrida]